MPRCWFVPPEQLRTTAATGGRGRFGCTSAASAVRPSANRRCGIDTVEIARIERLLARNAGGRSGAALSRRRNWPTAATAPAARPASRRASPPRRPASSSFRARRRSGRSKPHDFSVARDNYGAPQLVCSPVAAALLGRYRIKSIALSLSHDRVSASAVAVAEDDVIAVPLAGKVPLPVPAVSARGDPRQPAPRLRRARRRGRDRPAGAGALRAPVAAVPRIPALSLAVARTQDGAGAHRERRGLRRRARRRTRACCILTGHFGNWEVSTIAGLNHYPQMRGRFHFVRRAIKPAWLDALVTRRFNAAGFGVFPKRGSLDAMLDRAGRRRRDRVSVRPARAAARRHRGRLLRRSRRGRSRASRSSRWPPARRCCRRPAGARPTGTTCCVSRIPMAPIECENTGEAIRRNTRAYNAVLERVILRRPEQWYWVHRRWKAVQRCAAAHGARAQRSAMP